MSDLDQREGESLDAWLVRLRAMERDALSAHERRALGRTILEALRQHREDLERQILATLHAMRSWRPAG